MSKHLSVKVFPNAKKEVVEVDGERLRIFVREAPEQNQANRRVTELVAKYLGCASSDVRLIKGHKHQNKVYAITNTD